MRKAIIFSGLGCVADISDIDLAAWNAAFRAHGARWQWSWDTFVELMRPGGARNPIDRYAQHSGIEGNFAQITASHRRLFTANLSTELPLRPGLARVLRFAAQEGVGLGLSSRAEPTMVHAVLKATARERAGITFDALVCRDDVDRLAPHPDAFELAAERLRASPKDCLAVVDSPVSASAALDAGAKVLAVPGRLYDEQTFPSGSVVERRIRLEDVAPHFGMEATQQAAE